MIELGGEGLVVGQDEGGAADGLDDLGHGEGFAGAGDAEEDLVLLALADAAREFSDGVFLIAARAVVDGQPEAHNFRVAQIADRV